MRAGKPALCIVNPYEHGGGAEYQISLLIAALAELDRYEIHYLTHFVDGRDRPRRYCVSRIGDGGGIPRLGYLMEAPALYRRLRDLAPRVIYQRVACAYTGISALYAGRHAVPMLWHVAHDTDVSPQSLDPGRNLARVRLEKWAVNFGARRCTGIVVQTRHQAALLRANFDRAAAAVIANFHPPASEIIDKSGPLRVVWIANLKPWKRPEVFVRLASSLRDCPGVRFIMVGAPADGSANRRWQESLDREVRATPNLEFVGRKSHAEVNALLAGAHVFVNTSTQEGFPNTFIQAWLRDVAVVSLNVDPDGVLEGRNVGILAQSESGLSDAIRRFVADPQRLTEYALRGRAHAIAHHSLANAQELASLIDRHASRAS